MLASNFTPSLKERSPGMWYEDRSYETKEILLLLDYASQIDFSNTQFLRIDESSAEDKSALLSGLLISRYSLDSSTPEEETASESAISHNAPYKHTSMRLSKNINHKVIPDAISAIIKKSLYNWRFFYGQAGTYFARLFAFYINSEISYVLSQQNTNDDTKDFTRAADLFPSLISILTVKEFEEEAQALHEFMRFCKENIQVTQQEGLSFESVAPMVAPSLLFGLNIKDSIQLQFPKQSLSHIFKMFSVIIAENLKNNLFDNQYSPEVYWLYMNVKYQLNNGEAPSSQLDMSGNEAIYRTSLPQFGWHELEQGQLNQDYLDEMVTILTEDEPFSLLNSQIMANFFKNLVSNVMLTNGVEAGRQTHNVLYVFAQLYQDSPAKHEAHCQLLQHIFKLSINPPDLNRVFYDLAIKALFANDAIEFFQQPFHSNTYATTMHVDTFSELYQSRVVAFRQQEKRLNALLTQNHQQAQQLEDREYQINILRDQLAKLKIQATTQVIDAEVSIEDKELQISPESKRKRSLLPSFTRHKTSIEEENNSQSPLLQPERRSRSHSNLLRMPTSPSVSPRFRRKKRH